MKRLAILSFQYYRLLLVYNLAFTVLISAIFFLDAGTIDSRIFFFAKVMGFIAAGTLHYYTSKESYFYFRNAGFDMRKIIQNAFLIDIMVYILITISSTLLSYAAANFKG